jgi:hypothetical protein
MVEAKKWYRVIDPLSPLYGSDVLLSGEAVWNVAWATDEDEKFYQVIGIRRVDVFLGDRPFQLMAKDGDDLGFLISNTRIASSPIQDNVVVTGTDRPHGICIDETEMTRQDGTTLRIARYERATQIAVEDNNGDLMATHTDSTEFRDHWEKVIVGMFEDGDEVEDIAYALRSN